LASIITPNLPEAAALLDRPVARQWDEMVETAEGLQAIGACRVLLKGGHLQDEASPDLLLSNGIMMKLDAGRIDTENTHGTGCTLSSAIAALLPQHRDLATAIREAKAYITGAIAASGQLAVGGGHGPVHHFHQLWHQSRH
jgi:hydroxymethylpyrimidine/phosphomethylpyrimidine kinase